MTSSSGTEGNSTRLSLVLLLLPSLSSCARREAEPRGEQSSARGAPTSSPTADAVERAKELIKAERALFSRLEAQKGDPAASRLLGNLREEAEADAGTASMLDRLMKRKRLVWKSSPASIGGRMCRVLFFDPRPGPQPQTAVLTDEEYNLLTWKEIGGSPAYESARLEKRGGSTVLAVTCRHRHGPRGTYRYALSLEGISRIGNIEWREEDEAPEPLEKSADD